MSEFPFLVRLGKGDILVADGATGTNLQQRGLKHGTPAEAWLFEKPEQIIDLHMDFLQAGADILLTCTFGASPLRLEAGGMGGQVLEVNLRAVELARQAIAHWRQDEPPGGREVYVAGSIGPSGGLLKPYGVLNEEDVYASFTEQAGALSQAGVDLLVIETQFDLAEASLALNAARAASDLPVVVSFSYDRGTRTMMGVNPVKMAAEFTSLGADVLGINCGRSLDDNLKALQELHGVTSLPIWFKPNAGLPRSDSQGNSIYDLSPEQMGAGVPEWLDAGARVVGGCCGTSPEHLAQIARMAKAG
ncbi:MAG: homocysteine S-methyltransferase family protein [Anaerolineales bacterium]|nr:homocysteine S-methyltransferase family protein [Anaerolineales bacterium]